MKLELKKEEFNQPVNNRCNWLYAERLATVEIELFNSHLWGIFTFTLERFGDALIDEEVEEMGGAWQWHYYAEHPEWGIVASAAGGAWSKTSALKAMNAAINEWLQK